MERPSDSNQVLGVATRGSLTLIRSVLNLPAHNNKIYFTRQNPELAWSNSWWIHSVFLIGHPNAGMEKKPLNHNNRGYTSASTRVPVWIWTQSSITTVCFNTNVQPLPVVWTVPHQTGVPWIKPDENAAQTSVCLELTVLTSQPKLTTAPGVHSRHTSTNTSHPPQNPL